MMQMKPGAAVEQAVRPMRVLIVEDDTLVGIGLKAHLEKLGHKVIGQAADGAEATRFYTEENPDLVLMDICLDQTDGIELAGELLAKRRVPMIIISAYSESALIERAASVGVYGYLVKPVTAEALAAQIGVALTRFGELTKLMEENHSLLQTLETRKLVERAKGILMRRLNLAEPDAHRRLQQESQKRRISIAEIAKRIIESEELFSS
jgi:two-component system, response regulator PdtaR